MHLELQDNLQEVIIIFQVVEVEDKIQLQGLVVLEELVVEELVVEHQQVQF